MGKHWNSSELDAYGHLLWTVGNEDWIACFDAIRVGDMIHYEVVVDCESGGFTHTMETGKVRATSEGIFSLLWLPDYWRNVCEEHYANTQEYGTAEKECEADWQAHVRSLVSSQPPHTEAEGEEEETWDERTIRSWRP